jgi:uncharacterized membrane protein HdeD (DUF308 family)
MLRALTKKWWLPLADGICIALLGSLAFMFPDRAPSVLLACCTLYWCVDGLQSLGMGLAMRHARTRLSWQLLVSGLLSIAAACFTLAWPSSDAAFLYTVAIWAIAHGISEVVTGSHLRKYIHREWLLYAIGAHSIVLGIAAPLLSISISVIGTLFLIWMLSTFALVRGSLLSIFAFELRAHRPSYPARIGHSFTPDVARHPI